MSRAYGYLVAAGVVVSVAGAARADDPVTVNLTDGRTDRAIPIGRSFNLQGKASIDSQHLQVVVVRTGQPSLIRRSHVQCGDLAKTLNIEAPLADPVTAGITTAGAIFPRATAFQDEAALATVVWSRGDTIGPTEFKILVPADTGFFQAGWVYCLYLLENKLLVDDKKVSGALEALGTSLAACARQRPAEPSCETVAAQTFDAGLAKILHAPGVSADDARNVREKAIDEISDVRGFLVARDEFAVAAPLLLPSPLGRPARWLSISGTSADPDDSLAAFVANRLTVVAGGLLAAPVTSAITATPPGTTPPAMLAKYPLDGTYVVERLQILQNDLTIQVAGQHVSSAMPVKVLAPTTGDLGIGTGGATVADLLLLADQRLVIGNAVRELHDVRNEIAATPFAWSAVQAGLVTETYAKLAAITDAIDEVKRISLDPDRSSADAPPIVAGQLLTWLTAHGWDHGRFTSEVNLLRDMVRDHARWDAHKGGVAVTSKLITSRTIAGAPIHFDQKTWFFTYLTPVVGYAAPGGEFFTFYTGVQLHFWPNPTNEPLWTNGSTDFHRAWAVELAVVPGLAAFGPDKRYEGLYPDIIPPVFVGLGVHLLPYASLSGGAVLLSRRASALPGEDPRFHAGWYVGANVQLNVPDIIRQLMNPTANTSVDKR